MKPRMDYSQLRARVIPGLKPTMRNPVRAAPQITCIADDRPIYADGRCWRCFARQKQRAGL